jgi:hypothetical protein
MHIQRNVQTCNVIQFFTLKGAFGFNYLFVLVWKNLHYSFLEFFFGFI